jgi:RNase P protein component
LRDSDAFRRTVKSGRRAGSPALVVHLRVEPSLEHEPAEVGFVVSKAWAAPWSATGSSADCGISSGSS